jgi:hypothetical protein
VFYFQVIAAVVSILLGLTQITKEGVPLINEAVEKKHQSDAIKKIELEKQEAQNRANRIANMNIQWVFRNYDNNWRYYSDSTGTYWCRVNLAGVTEYSQNPNTVQLANRSNLIR